MINELDMQDDLLILAGDNLFGFSLAEFVKFANNHDSDALAMYKEDKLEQLKRSGVAEIDLEAKLIKYFEEKPVEPKSNFSVPVSYVLSASTTH